MTGSVVLVAKDTEQPLPSAVGVIGAGQLARMLGESASALGIELYVLAPEDEALRAQSTSWLVIGSPNDRASLHDLAAVVDVITLDHELVDLDLLGELVEQGHVVYPSPAATMFAARKDYQRRTFSALGVPVPAFCILDEWSEERFDAFAATLAAPPVVKATSGGYDGRGVVVAQTLFDARRAAQEFVSNAPVLLEERVELLGEIAVLLVTSATGERRVWPVVRTVQQDGICTEVRFPSGFSDKVEAEALEVATRVANAVGAVGVLAVELFVTSRGVIVNEVATRPHNSGHWTIEGTVTSQFENHLRAVLGLPLGSTEPTAPAVVMVNVVGSTVTRDVAAALAVDGLHLHDYAKQFRLGRKLGHVTVVGDDATSVRVRAWTGAEALGTAAIRESS